MPSHDEEKKRFYKNPREEPGKEFADSFKLFALKLELKEAINNPKGTKSEKERLKQYIELLEKDNKHLDKKRFEAESRVPSLSEGTPLTEAQKDAPLVDETRGLDNAAPDPNNEAAHLKPEGRPTYKDDIQEAGQSLLDSGEINPATPWKRIADKVRKLVQESVGTRDNRGLDDQTIRRHLKPILGTHGKARS